MLSAIGFCIEVIRLDSCSAMFSEQNVCELYTMNLGEKTHMLASCGAQWIQSVYRRHTSRKLPGIVLGEEAYNFCGTLESKTFA